MKIACEIEVAGIKLPAGRLLISGAQYDIGTDRSIKPYGNEIRTRPFLRHEAGNLKGMLSYLKEKGGYCNSTCGLHIHYDRPLGITYDYLKSRFSAMLPRILTEFKPRLKRLEYCNFELDSSRKYVAINWHPQGTIEMRFFNGCLNLRYICRAIDLGLLIINGPPAGAG